MKKLGYTWYPKDWLTSDGVFELTLSQRAVYREVIDMAMLNDNNVKMNVKSWARRFNSNINEIEEILEVLKQLELITIDNGILFIPSCENRLNMIRGARKGGQKSKPTIKPMVKPTPKQKKVNKKENNIPKKEDFIKYAFSQNDNCDLIKIGLKYESWKINNWRDGNDKPVKNWKSKLLNTIPFLLKEEISNSEAKLSQAPQPLN